MKAENKYRLVSTGSNSDKYGNCEICNTQCSEVFYSVEIKRTSNSFYGHKNCLIKKQK